MDNCPEKVRMLFVLLAMVEPVSIQMISMFSMQDKCEVRRTLRRWYGVLRVQGEEYSIYHMTFLEFLKSKDELDKHRPEFNTISENISNYYQGPLEDFLN